MGEDWDIGTVVWSCSKVVASSDNPLTCLASLTFDEETEDLSCSYFLRPSTSIAPPGFPPFNELEMSCWPFFRRPSDDSLANPSQLVFRPPVPPSLPTTTIRYPTGTDDPVAFVSQLSPYPHQLLCGEADPRSTLPAKQLPDSNLKSKKRKAPRRSVCHFDRETLSSDPWAWHKYGQKPVKGSPYPRSYYRCSSIKACMAKKQVERCGYGPDLFIVTYTGDHSHPQPPHRNSIAEAPEASCSPPKAQ